MSPDLSRRQSTRRFRQASLNWERNRSLTVWDWLWRDHGRERELSPVNLWRKPASAKEEPPSSDHQRKPPLALPPSLTLFPFTPMILTTRNSQLRRITPIGCWSTRPSPFFPQSSRPLCEKTFREARPC